MHDSDEAMSLSSRSSLDNTFDELVFGEISTRDKSSDTPKSIMENSSCNDSPPITRLPDEILLLIFACFNEAVQPGRPNAHPPIVNQAGGYSWTQLMLVCRRWRDVALATPTLWRTIHIGDRFSKWTDLTLKRSYPATIDVFVPPGSISQEQLTILYQHLHRLRSLSSVNWSPSFLSIFQSGTQTLETLAISGLSEDSLQQDEAEAPDLTITCRRFPRLIALSITHVVAPTDPLIFSQLRQLMLDRCPCTLSFERFIQVLADSPCLESLDLRHFLDQLHDDAVNGGLRRSPRILPSLHVLNLANHPPSSSSRFLSYVSLPPHTSVRISGNMEPGQGETAPSLTTLLPPDPAGSLPLLTTLTRVMVRAASNSFSVSDRPLERDQAKVYLELAAPSTVAWEARLEYGLNDFISIFAPATATLTHLEIGGDCSTASAETWAAAFRAFPALTYLEAGADEVIFVGLSPAPTDITDSQVVCPRLERIWVDGEWETLEAMREACDHIVHCLRSRAEKGVPLRALHLECYDRKGDAKADFKEKYEPVLRNLVGELVFVMTVW